MKPMNFIIRIIQNFIVLRCRVNSLISQFLTYGAPHNTAFKYFQLVSKNCTPHFALEWSSN